MDSKSKEFQLRAGTNFLFFCEHVLGLEISEHHKELVGLPMNNRYLAVILPTGHSKTTIFSFAYPLWRLYSEKNIEVCLVSSSLEQAMKLFRRPQDELEANPFFSDLLPRNRFDTWNKSFLETANKNQFYVKPFNHTARGIHPHYLIYDDLLRENDTPMEQIKEIFWSVFFPRGQIHNCQHIIVGTPLSLTDLYADLERNPDWTFIRKPAVIEENGKWVKPLWPERFSMRSLMEIRKNMTDFRFDREYLCRPKASGDTLIPQEMILESLDDDLEYLYTFKGTPSMGADFAMSTKASGDYNAFVVVDDMQGKTHVKNVNGKKVQVENPVVIRKIKWFRGNVGQVEIIKSLVEGFPESRVIADESGVGAKFVQELRDEQIDVEAQDFRPAARNMLLMNMRRLFEQGRIVIPNKGEEVPLTDRLIKELSGFHLVKTRAGSETWQSNVDHDDLPISLSLAVKNIGFSQKTTGDLVFGIPA